MLGAGSYEVVATDWQAKRVVWQSTSSAVASVKWNREKNEVSQAEVEAVVSPAVADRLEPWLHTLTIYRDGLLVWHGIIVRTVAGSRRVRIAARDGSVFFDRRRVPIGRTWFNHDATQVMRTMVEDACGYQDATGLVDNLAALESRIWVTSTYTPSECLVAEAVDDVVKQGLVWCVSSGRLLIGPIGAQRRTGILSDHHLDGNVTVVKDGMETVTDAHITGKGVWGQWAAEESPLPLLQSLGKADGAISQEDCEEVARREVEDASVTPRRLAMPSSARLLPTAPVSIEDLVPGVVVPVSSTQTGIRVASDMSVREVSVTADDGGESINVTLSEIHVTDRVTFLPPPSEPDYRSPWEREQESRNTTGAGSGGDKDEEPVGTAPA